MGDLVVKPRINNFEQLKILICEGNHDIKTSYLFFSFSLLQIVKILLSVVRKVMMRRIYSKVWWLRVRM